MVVKRKKIFNNNKFLEWKTWLNEINDIGTPETNLLYETVNK